MAIYWTDEKLSALWNWQMDDTGNKPQKNSIHMTIRRKCLITCAALKLICLQENDLKAYGIWFVRKSITNPSVWAELKSRAQLLLKWRFECSRSRSVLFSAESLSWPAKTHHFEYYLKCRNGSRKHRLWGVGDVFFRCWICVGRGNVWYLFPQVL